MFLWLKLAGSDGNIISNGIHNDEDDDKEMVDDANDCEQKTKVLSQFS